MMSHRSLSVLVCFLTACGGAPERLYYESSTMTHKEVSRLSEKSLRHTARTILANHTVYLRYRSKTYRKLAPSQVDGLPPVAMWALHMTNQARFKGAEVDLRVWHKGKTRIPVSVRIDMTGRIKIDVGDGKWARRFKTKRMPRYVNGQAKWTTGTKDVVQEAFDILDPAEYTAIKKIPFRREIRSSDKRKSAHYVQKNCSADIRVYTGAFGPDKWQFIGDAHKIRRSSVRTILHEIGHAIERRASLIAYCRYKKAHKKLNHRIQTYNHSRKKSRAEAVAIREEKARLDRMVERIEDLTENSPVLRAYRTVAPDGASPTVYGETSDHESFAESFSLYRADPSALGRVLPRVLAWFERGEHIRAMRQAEERARR